MILDYGRRLDRADNADYLPRNPFALLLGIIFDQGTRANESWEAPKILKERLGTISPQKIAEMDLRKIKKVIRRSQSGKALHRYVNKLPVWTREAARKVVGEYDGKTENIWKNIISAREIMARLDGFLGIGQKKATMGTRIIKDEYGLKLKYWEDIDISVDVMIRRVFLRTDLVDHDDFEEVKEIARKLSPNFPGKLDYPTWVIGRNWCLQSKPLCDGGYDEDTDKETEPCPLFKACPKYKRRKPVYQ